MVRILENILKNKVALVIIAIYVVLMVRVIRWGIPNTNHPFNYHMDEWHQMQSVRALFTQGTSNVSGAAHGPIFQFLLSGIYVGMFSSLGIIDPFVLKSAVTQLAMQEKLFIVLRSNTLIFGTLALIFLGIIARKYFKVHPGLTIASFAITPLWLSLSNYFKYDIALTFWIILSIFFLLRFGTFPNKKDYLLAGIFCSLAVATKISAMPLFIIYIVAFFHFNFKKQKDYSYFILGIFLFFLVFLVFGIPDALLQKGDYGDFFYSNIISDPKKTDNFILDYYPWWIYIILKTIPLNFGYPFFIIYICSIFYFLRKLMVGRFKENLILHKNEIFLLICLFIFIISLVPLKIGANGNRLLVLLPFLSLLSSSYLSIIWKSISQYSKKLLVLLISIVIVFQVYQSFALVYVKWSKDVRETSSVWLDENIPNGEKIGIENIPIYQYLPDIAVKEFYLKQSFPKTHTKFDYIVIESSKVLPNVVIVTDREFGVDYQKDSPEKLLVNRLEKEKYKIIAEFKPHNVLYNIFGNELNMRISGLVPIPTITIYKKS